MITQRSVWMRTLLPTWILLLYSLSFAQPTTLEVSQPVTRTLNGGAQHSYTLALAADQYLHVIVDQRGIDVVLILFGPDGKKLLEVDSPNGEQGPEPLHWVTEGAGNYRLEVRSLEATAAAGQYVARLVVLQPARELDRKRARAQIAFAEGERLFDEQKAASFRLALAQYEQALPLFRELGEREREGFIELKLGMTRNNLSEKTEALEHFQRAVQLYRRTPKRDWEGVAWNNVGTIRTELGQKRQALAAFTEALSLLRAAKDRIGEAIALNGLGAAHRDLGERQKALQYYEAALRIRRELKDRTGEAMILHNLAVLYDDLGEVQKQLDTHAQALPLRRDPLGRGITLMGIGRSYDQLGLPQEALSYYHQALPLVRSVGNKLWEARTLNMMGLAFWALGDHAAALAHINLALPLYRAVKSPAGEASALNNIGLVYSSLNEPRRALEVYQQALPLQRAVGDRQGEANVLCLMGLAYDRLGERAKALAHHKRSLELSRAVSDPRRTAKAHYGIARIERDRGNFKQARAQIEQSIQLVESLRAKLDSPDLRVSYRNVTAQYYEFYIDLLMRMRRQADGKKFVALALQASEQARARSLLEMLNETGAEIRSDAAPALVARERELQAQLTDKAAHQLTLLSGSHTEEQATTVAREVEALTTTLRDVQAELRRASPRYAALTQPQPLTLSELQRMLDADTILLEYALGEERSYLWAVTHKTMTSYELPRRAEIERLARQFYELLTDPKKQQIRGQRGLQVGTAESASFAQVGAQLSRLLLAPVASQLGRKRLLIVADGALQYVPFAALPDCGMRNAECGLSRSAGEREKGRRGEKQSAFRIPHSAFPLIVNHEILTAPSASTLAVQRRLLAARPPAPKTLLVLADPVFDAADDRVPKNSAKPANKSNAAETRGLTVKQAAIETGVMTAGLNVPRLPGTRQEAEQILAFAPAEQRTEAVDFQASRATLQQADLSQYRFVHFATHGFLNSVHPELSGLVLSLVNEKGEPQPAGFLLAHEVYNLDLNADLVTLSACQTGLGKEVKGEGIVGLTRGLLYAGAARVVVSLWNVDDTATSELMTRFYRGMLQQKLRPAAALRAAQIEMWKQEEWRAPYFWAAFGLQGEWH